MSQLQQHVLLRMKYDAARLPLSSCFAYNLSYLVGFMPVNIAQNSKKTIVMKFSHLGTDR